MECMRICFSTGGSLEDFSTKYASRADVVCLSFQALGEVSYERELKGETALFEDVAVLSRELDCVVVCGCYTDARGAKRKSVVVAEKGRILGVSDAVNRVDGGPYRSGAGIKIYDTGVGKLGVIVADDLFFPRVAETLSLCGAELILCVLEELDGTLEQILMRAQAFLYGVPICTVGYGFAQAADITGKLRFGSPVNGCVYDFEREQEYHLVETRRRGLSRRKKTGF